MADPTTSRLALTYPQNSDAANVPLYIQTIADQLDALVTAYTSGTAAARPATPSSGAGTLYEATDTGEITWYTGSTWVPFGPAVTLAIAQAKGDLLVASGAAAVDRLAVGADGTALIADSTQSLGVKWAQAGGAVASLERQAITAANTWQNAATYPNGTANARYVCCVSFDVPSGGASIAAQVEYTRAGVARTDTIYPTGQGNAAAGAQAPVPLFVDADASTSITIQVQSSSTATAVTSAIEEA